MSIEAEFGSMTREEMRAKIRALRAASQAAAEKAPEPVKQWPVLVAFDANDPQFIEGDSE